MITTEIDYLHKKTIEQDKYNEWIKKLKDCISLKTELNLKCFRLEFPNSTFGKTFFEENKYIIHYVIVTQNHTETEYQISEIHKKYSHRHSEM